MDADYESITIEPGGKGMTYSRNDGYTVYGHGVYPESSVLAGSPLRQWLDHFETLEEAKKAYPNAEVIGGSSYQQIYLPETPPDWFDPANAGEEW